MVSLVAWLWLATSIITTVSVVIALKEGEDELNLKDPGIWLVLTLAVVFPLAIEICAGVASAHIYFLMRKKRNARAVLRKWVVLALSEDHVTVVRTPEQYAEHITALRLTANLLSNRELNLLLDTQEDISLSQDVLDALTDELIDRRLAE